ncbi:MAP kinase kinase kinase kinase [Aureococcus anophagefferens]|nr:MAP kinase kinase kinase kinase [Aureococcus anophagefferens]
MSSSMTAAKDAVAAVVVAAEGTSSPAHYALEERVGVGSFGIVYKARVKGSSEHVAIKVVDLEGSAAELEDVRRELEALASVRCTRLVHYLGAHVVGSQLWIVTEYLAGGSLGDLLNSLAAPLAEPVVAGVVAELLEALAYLHGDRRVHRDVKAKNVLVARDGRVKLADFGVATRLTDTSTKRQSLIGTPYWMAPEVLEQSRYGSAADVWSLGITAFELATGKPPHWELHPMKVLFVVPKAPPPKLEGDFSAEATAFAARCLAKAPEERPTCADLLVDADRRQRGARPSTTSQGAGRVDATLDDGKLTTAFAAALASALEKQRASLGSADTPSPGSLASASPASRGASPAGVGAPPR